MKNLISFSFLVLAILVSRANTQVLELLGGRYTAAADVSEWANLALDIAEMRESSDAEEIKDIYSNGRNANYTDDTGNIRIRSLASLSLYAPQEMREDAMFNFFRHAFLTFGSEVEGEDLGVFDEKLVGEYANTLILDLLDLGKAEMVADSAIVMNVWMYIVHSFYNVLRACQRNDGSSEEGMQRAIDVAAALWIGNGQEEGDNDTGNLLYNLAEAAGSRFGQDVGETLVNTAIIANLNAIKLSVSTGICADAGGYEELRSIVRDLIGDMTVPLVQNLIHFISEPASPTNSDQVELYTLSFTPRVEGCMPTTFERMLDTFVRADIVAGQQQAGVELVQSVFTCVEITCELVGSYRSGVVPECSDVPDSGSFILVGYPLSFNVSSYARIDRDIKQIRILTKTMAYNAAIDYYSFGYNAMTASDEFLSLKSLATSAGRSVVGTQYDLFVDYFEDNNYADTFVMEALKQESSFSEASTGQVQEIVLVTLTTMVSYMAILEHLYMALDSCKTADGDSASIGASIRHLEIAISFYVGSIEGNEMGGLDGGEMLYGLSKSFCSDFGVCFEGSGSVGNDLLIVSFESASNFLANGECDFAEVLLVNEIAPVLFVPLIQGTMATAAQLEALPTGTNASALGSGFSYSRSILPQIDSALEESGQIISRNMEFQLTRMPAEDGTTAIFEAMTVALPFLETPNVLNNCPVIGVFQDGRYGDVCNADATIAPASMTNSPVAFSETPVAPVTTFAPVATAAPAIVAPVATVAPATVAPVTTVAPATVAPVTTVAPVAPIGTMAPVAPIDTMAPIDSTAPIDTMAPIDTTAPIAPIAPIDTMAPNALIDTVAPIASAAPSTSSAPAGPIGPIAPISPIVPPSAAPESAPSAPVLPPMFQPSTQTPTAFRDVIEGDDDDDEGEGEDEGRVGSGGGKKGGKQNKGSHKTKSSSPSVGSVQPPSIQTLSPVSGSMNKGAKTGKGMGMGMDAHKVGGGKVTSKSSDGEGSSADKMEKGDATQTPEKDQKSKKSKKNKSSRKVNKLTKAKHWK